MAGRGGGSGLTGAGAGGGALLAGFSGSGFGAKGVFTPGRRRMWRVTVNQRVTSSVGQRAQCLACLFAHAAPVASSRQRRIYGRHR